MRTKHYFEEYKTLEFLEDHQKLFSFQQLYKELDIEFSILLPALRNLSEDDKIVQIPFAINGLIQYHIKTEDIKNCTLCLGKGFVKHELCSCMIKTQKGGEIQ